MTLVVQKKSRIHKIDKRMYAGLQTAIAQTNTHIGIVDLFSTISHTCAYIYCTLPWKCTARAMKCTNTHKPPYHPTYHHCTHKHKPNSLFYPLNECGRTHSFSFVWKIVKIFILMKLALGIQLVVARWTIIMCIWNEAFHKATHSFLYDFYMLFITIKSSASRNTQKYLCFYFF